MNQQFKGYPFEAKRYPASLPPLKGGVDPKRRPVVVVGGGPVGYCTALGFASYGVPVVLVEADDSVCFGSRAICISRRSLEIVERLGAIDRFLCEFAVDGRPQLLSQYGGAALQNASRREPKAAADDQSRAIQHRAISARRGRGAAISSRSAGRTN